jgi:hypothetical protein
LLYGVIGKARWFLRRAKRRLKRHNPLPVAACCMSCQTADRCAGEEGGVGRRLEAWAVEGI